MRHRAGTLDVSERNFNVADYDLEDRKLQEAELPLLEEESGATLIEYGLVVGVLAMGTILAMTSLKNNIGTLMSAVGSQIMSAT